MEILRPYFVRNIDNLPEVYQQRLQTEIEMLEKLDFIWFIKRFIEIFNAHIKNNLYLLRGSAGSSLLLYYLGVNEIDPVAYNIPLSRFVNKLRLTKPDIDIDLPQSLRDKIINEIVTSVHDTVRMSCNLRNENNEHFDSLVREHPEINSIHNSGVIIYSKDQSEIIKKNIIADNQIGLTKDDIGDLNLKKIDLLSNTALEQLDKIQLKLGTSINYDFNDKNVYDFIVSDDGCGVTYAETPLIQYVIRILKPSCLSDLSMCLAIVRPFACQNINKYMTCKSLEEKIIYDDDFILSLVKNMNFSEEQADQIRRVCKKGTDLTEISDFVNIVNSSDMDDRQKWLIKKALPKLKSYGFCKSHSLSYARLIYMLYYCKYYYPKIFWEATLKTIKGYYNDWVYIRKGLQYGLRFKGIKQCDPFSHFVYTGYWLNKEFMSKCYLKIYDSQLKSLKITINNDEDCDNVGTNENTEGDNENNAMEYTIAHDDIDNYYLSENTNKKPQLVIPKITSENDEVINLNKECEFRGLIAGTTSTYTKYRKYQTIITIGYGNDQFIDLYLNKKRDFKKFKQVIGKGYYINDTIPHIVISHLKIF
jgi:hypothetical protein